MASGPESSRATSSLPCVKMGSNPDVWVMSFCSKQIHWFISLLIVSGVYTIEWILSPPPRLIFFPATRPIGLQYLWFPTFRPTWQGVELRVRDWRLKVSCSVFEIAMIVLMNDMFKINPMITLVHGGGDDHSLNASHWLADMSTSHQWTNFWSLIWLLDDLDFRKWFLVDHDSWKWSKLLLDGQHSWSWLLDD